MNVIIFNGTQKIGFVNDLSMVRDYTFLRIHIARQRASHISHKEAVYIIFKYKIYEIVS